MTEINSLLAAIAFFFGVPLAAGFVFWLSEGNDGSWR